MSLDTEHVFNALTTRYDNFWKIWHDSVRNLSLAIATLAIAYYYIDTNYKTDNNNFPRINKDIYLFFISLASLIIGIYMFVMSFYYKNIARTMQNTIEKIEQDNNQLSYYFHQNNLLNYQGAAKKNLQNRKKFNSLAWLEKSVSLIIIVLSLNTIVLSFNFISINILDHESKVKWFLLSEIIVIIILTFMLSYFRKEQKIIPTVYLFRIYDAKNLLAIRKNSNSQDFIELLSHNKARIEYYAPVGTDNQQPHQQDEVYVIASGSGIFDLDGKKSQFQTGDLIYVPAHTPHHFENFSTDFATWVIFF